MTVQEFIDRAVAIPYLEGGSDWSGIDCFGLVELWYREVLGIDLSDRGNLSCDPVSLHKSYISTKLWRHLQDPEDHCVIMMTSPPLRYGHCGMHYQGFVHHIGSEGGYQCMKFNDKRISFRASGIVIHQDLLS